MATDYGRLGEYERSIHAYQQTIRINPDFKEAHFGLSISYYLSADHDMAMKRYNVLKTLDEDMAKNLLDAISK